ncbi:hypothetical protein V8E36_007426 [Tilletia maclaganii]
MRSFLPIALCLPLVAQAALGFAPGAPAHIHAQLAALSKTVKDTTAPVIDGVHGALPALNKEAGHLRSVDDEVEDVTTELEAIAGKAASSRRAVDVDGSQRFVIKRSQ